LKVAVIEACAFPAKPVERILKVPFISPSDSSMLAVAVTIEVESQLPGPVVAGISSSAYWAAPPPGTGRLLVVEPCWFTAWGFGILSSHFAQ
jgi:hypothetical protein